MQTDEWRRTVHAAILTRAPLAFYRTPLALGTTQGIPQKKPTGGPGASLPGARFHRAVSSAWKEERNVMTMGWHVMMGFGPSLLACYTNDEDHSFDLIRRGNA